MDYTISIIKKEEDVMSTIDNENKMIHIRHTDTEPGIDFIDESMHEYKSINN